MRPRCIAILFALVPAAFGQSPVQVTGVPAGRIAVSDVGEAMVVADAAPAADGGEPQPAAAPPAGSPLLQQLKQTQFDRRPSMILKAWSTPELEPLPPEMPPEPDAAAPAAAAPAPSEPTLLGPPAMPPDFAARQQAYEQKRLQRDLQILQRHVAQSRWDRVGAWLGQLGEKEAREGFEQLLRSLQNAPPAPNQNNLPPQFHEHNAFSFDDIIGLCAIAPGKLQRKQAALLAPIVQRALDDGHVIEGLVARLREQADQPEPTRTLSPRQAAWILSAIGQDIELGPFLPDAATAVQQSDREALNLLARHHLAVHARDKKTIHLENAWTATQAALATGTIDEAEKAEALRRAVELAPKIRAALGEAWLQESFTSRPERGMEVLATIGTQAARGFQEHAQDPDFRLKGLELLKTATEALLRAAPERGKAWQGTLNLLASSWLAEAQHSYANSSATSMGQRMQRDQFGNIFYWDPGNFAQHQVQPLDPGKLLALAPGKGWLELLDASVQPRFAMVTAQLLLKVNEEKAAFPFIAALAATHPRNAKELAEEFLRVWTRNHNPNAERNQTNPYMFMYGFEQRANGIPLTRSKQERNLQNLAQWVAKIRSLPIDKVDEKLLVGAFTASHSDAEVYRTETIESVFGAMDALTPTTIAELAQKMRNNLTGVWREPAVQQNKKTNRRQKDIEAEVRRGYEVARATIEHALERHHDHWALRLAEAALRHDENNYRQEIAKDTEFASRRAEAMAAFARAAELYAAAVGSLAIDAETTEVYERWFYAGLGACDLQFLDEKTVADPRQPELIRAALTALPGETGVRHMAMFANTLFTRLSGVKPAVKHRYLQAGFAIVGDHPQAHEARKVFDYYDDLVTEIRLDATVDGDAVIGCKQPFGVRVNLRHTREIEREAGGFAKYLQNQNNSQSFAYNYGRPLENYRDKFQEAATQALQEHFEVLSVTFNGEDVNSKATADYGWRVTPYAYLLLKARGPQVDALPSLRLDLDFLDTSGYVVLPIASPAVPVDASREPTAARPYHDLELTQILDERRADAGKLVLEIKASAKGLVPDLDQLLAIAPTEFDVVSIDNPGVSVSRFDEAQEGIVSERTWVVALTGKSGLDHPARTFRFGTPRTEGTKLLYQRYADADLVTASPEVELGERYGTRAWPWRWLALGVAALALAGFWLWHARRRPRAAASAARLQVPDPLTPFTVLALLREIGQGHTLDAAAAHELDAAITRIERFYFAPPTGEAPDLRQLAEHWVGRAS